MTPVRQLVLATGALALAALGAGCGDDGGGGEDEDALGVQVLHLAPEVEGVVDVLIDGAEVPALIGLGFGDATPFLDLGVGPVDVSVVPSGTDGPPMLSVPGVRFDAGRTLLMVFETTVPDGSSADLDLIAFGDDRAPPAPGRASLRFFNLVAGVPPVSIDLDGERVVSGLRLNGGSAPVETAPGEPVLGLDIFDEPEADVVGTLPRIVGDRPQAVVLARVPGGPTPVIEALVTDDLGRRGQVSLQ